MYVYVHKQRYFMNLKVNRKKVDNKIRDELKLVKSYVSKQTHTHMQTHTHTYTYTYTYTHTHLHIYTHTHTHTHTHTLIILFIIMHMRAQTQTHSALGSQPRGPGFDPLGGRRYFGCVSFHV